MWWRVAAGVVALAVGGLWIAQGVGLARGSFMTDQSQYTVLGIVVVLVGLGLLAWAAALVRRRRAV